VTKNRFSFCSFKSLVLLLRDGLNNFYVCNYFQEGIFRVVAAILHLGNVNFAKGQEIDSSVIKDEKSRFHLSFTSELLRYIFCTFPCLNNCPYLDLLVIYCISN
jgi:hypothetical protein